MDGNKLEINNVWSHQLIKKCPTELSLPQCHPGTPKVSSSTLEMPLGSSSAKRVTGHAIMLLWPHLLSEKEIIRTKSQENPLSLPIPHPRHTEPWPACGSSEHRAQNLWSPAYLSPHAAFKTRRVCQTMSLWKSMRGPFQMPFTQ